jgi:hypothetical protein
LGDIVLDDTHLTVLLRLLDVALSTRIHGSMDRPIAAAAHGVRLRLTPAQGFTTITTKQGSLRIDGYALSLFPAEHTLARVRS